MKTVNPSPERYIQTILENLYASEADRERIAADLRSHFQAAAEAGEPPEQVISRLGRPLEVAEAYMANIPLAYATLSRRLLAFAIDMLLIIGFGSILSFLVIVCANRAPLHPTGIDYLVGAFWIALAVGFSLAVFGLVVLYFPLLEGRFGQTLGKRSLGLHVRKENGLPLGYKEAFIRNLSYYFEMLPIDALFIFFTEKKQRAFDIVAKTVVVNTDK